MASVSSSSNELALNSFYRRVPDELVQLEAQACGNFICQHPLRQFPGIEQAVRTVAASRCIFAECGGEQHGVHALCQFVLPRELTAKLIIDSIAKNELYFVTGCQSRKIFVEKRVGLTGVRTLHVDNLDHIRWNPLHRPLSAGLQQ